MKNVLFYAAAMLAIGGNAYAAGPHQGLKVGLEGMSAKADLKYTGGKPNEGMSGAMFGGIVGYDYQFGDNGPVIGAAYRATFTNLNAKSQRDGNYITQGGSLQGFQSVEGRVGWAINKWLPYVGAGRAKRDLMIYQSCPDDPASVVAGFCAGGFVPATAQARKGRTEGHVKDDATIYRVGLEYAASDRVSVGVSYYSAGFDTVVVPFANPAIPATNPDEKINGVSMGVTVRLF